MAARLGGPALGSESGGFGFDGDAQFHDVQDTLQGIELVRVYAEGAVVVLFGDEGAHTLAGEDQAVGAEGRDRLANHGAADAERGDELLFGREFGTGCQSAQRICWRRRWTRSSVRRRAGARGARRLKSPRS